MKVFNWFFSIFCILCLVLGFNIGTIMMCILGIVSLPVKAIRDKWENLPGYKVLRPLIIGVLFVLIIGLVPTNDTETNKKENKAEITDDATIETPAPTSTPEPTSIPALTSTPESTPTPAPTSTPESAPTPTPVLQTKPSAEITLSVADIPAYAGNPYVAVNNNVPAFAETDLSTTSYEYYSELDSLGRCGVVYACIGKDLMPTEERGEIGPVKPTGWHTVKYNGVVDGNYLYNRCHLIGYQLSGENANTRNLITGTRYMNVDGMLPFENMIADYVKETGNHVMYRVFPVFDGNNLLASGVQMEAISVEDKGAGIMFNVYCYNVQPGVMIDYASGNSSLEASVADNSASASTQENTTSSNTTVVEPQVQQPEQNVESTTLVWKSATGDKYHSINNCGRMNPDKATQLTESEAQAQGLEKCSKCW